VKNLLPAVGGGIAVAPARAPTRAVDVEHLPVAGMPADISNRKLAAGLTAIQFGAFGIHKFILGQTTAALIMLLVTLLTFGFGAAVMVVIGMMEGIKYLRMSDEEFYEAYLVNRKAWF
jgi:TM2 domain-containing membrane protein YozV